MSLRGKEVRPLIEPRSHEKLAIMAEHKDVQLAEFAARLLENAVEYEWHQVSVMLARSARLGKRWKAVESDEPDLFGERK